MAMSRRSLDQDSDGAEKMTIRITDWQVNRFLDLWHICYHPDTSPENPPEKLVELIESAQKITDGIYANGRWLFLIADNMLFDIVRIPIITDHAKKRLKERFGYSGRNLPYYVVSEIYAGRPATKKEVPIDELFRKYHKIRAVIFENHIYLLSEDAGYSLVTVFNVS